MYYLLYLFLFFFKQKTAYEMRISDWSSDVCSSDLSGRSEKRGGGERRHEKDVVDLQPDRHRNAQARKEEQPGAAALFVHAPDEDIESEQRDRDRKQVVGDEHSRRAKQIGRAQD